MSDRTCSIEGCARKHYAHGWCNTHYQRWRKWGDPLKTTIIRGDHPERLATKITVTESGCWQWNSPRPDGYGMVRWAGKSQLAHRVFYELHVGPIPVDAELDHACHSVDVACPGGPCRHRACVNPAHLEPVAPLVNVHRALRNNRQVARTHCPQGHPYADANLYVSPRGGRGCRKCRDDASRRHRARRAVPELAAQVVAS